MMILGPIALLAGGGATLIALVRSAALQRRAGTAAQKLEAAARHEDRRAAVKSVATRAAKSTRRVLAKKKKAATGARARAKHALSRTARKAATTAEHLLSEPTQVLDNVQPKVVRVVPDKPAPTPARKKKRLSPKGAAKKVEALVRGVQSGAVSAGALGTKGRPSGSLQKWQRVMGKIAADGIYGPKTQARAERLLGHSIPSRAAAERTKPAPTPAPAPTPVATVAPRVAAEQLWQLATAKIRAGNGAQLGTKAHPSEEVRRLQRDMRGLVADGIYGTKTRARGKELLGREFPARTSTSATSAPSTTAEPVLTMEREPAAQRAPQQAAMDLYAFAQNAINAGEGAKLGVKDHPSAEVQSAQADMGGLVADGFYGPATRARGKELTGLTFPVRT